MAFQQRIADTQPCPDHHGCFTTYDAINLKTIHSIHSSNEGSVGMESNDKIFAEANKTQQPMLAVIDDKLALEAFGTNIIVKEDKFRTGYECSVCDGICHGTVKCPRCNGTKTVKAPAIAGEPSEGLVPCKACLVASNTGNMIPCGFIPCDTCKGRGASIVVPEESMRRPSSGTVVSTGEGVLKLKCGTRVLYSNHAGYAMNFKQQTVFRIMHEHEVLSLLHGVGDIGKRLD
jgi:co-chaperonin GroES (HSP10)